MYFQVNLNMSNLAFFAAQRRCFRCRSRGKMGDCRDNFPYNATHLVQDVEAVGCASGWCIKMIEGDKNGEGEACPVKWPK